MTIEKQLSQLEQQVCYDRIAEAEFKRKLFTKVQRSFDLPLPPGSDLVEGVKRIRVAFDKASDEAFDDFRQWVVDEKRRVADATNCV